MTSDILDTMKCEVMVWYTYQVDLFVESASPLFICILTIAVRYNEQKQDNVMGFKVVPGDGPRICNRRESAAWLK